MCDVQFEFTHVSGRYREFCSPECKASQAREWGILSSARLALGERRNKEHRPHKVHRKPPRHAFRCEAYGSDYVGAKTASNRFCSNRCRDRHYQDQRTALVQAQLVDLSCPTCNEVFRQKQPGQKYCSRKCEKVQSWSSSTHRRRSRTAFSDVNPFAVFTRDGWSCKICGRDTPRPARGTWAPNAPELDHIIPLAAGGVHSYENTQCACRSCNIAKGARVG